MRPRFELTERGRRAVAAARGAGAAVPAGTPVESVPPDWLAAFGQSGRDAEVLIVVRADGEVLARERAHLALLAGGRP